MSPTNPVQESVRQVESQLREAGLYAALRYLNARTRHRYTGVYRIDPPLLRNVCLFDRENPDVRSMTDLILRDSYCGIVAELGVPFSIENSLTDDRLRTHPARASMAAYHGIPLRDEIGACFGTLCHWDVRPRVPPEAELPLLFAIAPLVARAVVKR